MQKAILFFTVVVAMGNHCLFGQDTDSDSHNLIISFPEVALIDIEANNGTEVEFEISSSGIEAGEALVIHDQRDELWINYTSLIASDGTQRSISVEAGPMPEIPGLVISLEAKNHSGNGGGDFGLPTPSIQPSSSPTNIITGIGSAYTGDGSANGHQLVYSLDFEGEISDLSFADELSTSILMTYTITD